jgi:hypothetical protein
MRPMFAASGSLLGMANRLAETGLPWDPEEIDLTGAPLTFLLRPKTFIQRGPVTWVDEGGSWQATIGRWSAHVLRGSGEPPAWEWRAFAVLGSRPRALGGRSWSAREDAQQDAERTLAELD